MAYVRKRYKILYTIAIVLMIIIPPIRAQSSSWKIWVTPETSVFHKNKNYFLAISLTGYGQLQPSNIKMVVHTTPDVKLKSENLDQYYDTIILPFKSDAPDNIFYEKLRMHGYDNNLFLKADVEPAFIRLIFKPISSGDKYIDFFATYSSDGTNWNTTHYRYTFHVNTWYENNEKLIIIFTILFGISTLLANVYVLYTPIKNYFFYKKSKSK